MELYHNQVTRAQGSFSLRMFHRSWGIMKVESNISAPCAVLDFPTRDDFARQLKTNHYDVVGISGIIANVAKVREMCRMTRDLSLYSVIIVGGHVAAIPEIEKMIDADHIVKGEGVSWMRRYLGEDGAPIRHPSIISGMRTRIVGIRLPGLSRTLLAGFKRYKDDPDPRVRERFRSEMGRLSGVYGCARWTAVPES
jgi:hypothetical protein